MKIVIGKMKQFIHRIGLYGLFFIFIVVVFSGISAKNVFKFWIEDEADYNEWSVELGKKGENDFVNHFCGKKEFVNFNGFVRNMLGQREMNGVIKLNNGYLCTTYEYESDEVLKEKVDNLYGLKRYLEEQNIPILFASAPYTVSKFDPQLPIGVEDYGNDNLDRFIRMAEDAGIETMDFREIMHEEGIDQYEMMYRTDHHWTTQAGFYAAEKISEWIEQKTAARVDEEVFDLDNYTLTSYEEWHLGSRGQRTGKYFAGIDDFMLITPDFDTSLICEGREGSFEELVINIEPLQNREYTSRYTYDHVLENALKKYENPNALNDTKVLVVTDSFGSAVLPYLLLSYSEVCTRYRSPVTRTYIEEYDPDVVIVLRYPDYVMKSGFNFWEDR